MGKHGGKKRRREKDGSMDRISELPAPILHHILCFLTQKEAVQTCVLSKPWRHLGITRPKIEFHQNMFPDNKGKSMSVFEKTLQRYHDQNLSIQEFVLSFFPRENPQSVAILENWILIVLQKGVKKIDLNLGSVSQQSSLLSVIFQAQSLEELYLRQCLLNNSIDNVLLKDLRKLSLQTVFFAQETLNKIFSSCPLLECVVLDFCMGLTTINEKEVHNLKRFECCCSVSPTTTRIEFNSQTLETIRIDNYRNWYRHHHNEYFPRLKTLCLDHVLLPIESFNIFSCNFPCLEELELVSCNGFEQVRLSSPSIKSLTNKGSGDSMKAFVIDAPNILYFDFSGDWPPFVSFSNFTNDQLKAHIDLTCRVDFDDDDAFSTWFLRLNELLKALTQSRVSLDFLWFHYPMSQITFCDSYEPVQVENLIANRHLLSSDFPDSLNLMFRICRPMYITDIFLYVDAKYEWEREHNSRVYSLCNFFLEGITTSQRCFWMHDLKQATMETFDENAKEWRLV